MKLPAQFRRPVEIRVIECRHCHKRGAFYRFRGSPIRRCCYCENIQ